MIKFHILVALLLYSMPVSGEIYGPYRALYVKNHDGDTFTLVLFIYPEWRHKSRFRLNGIDTPEIDTAKCDREKTAGIAAREFVKGMLRSTVITVMVYEKQTFGRQVADVFVDNQDLRQLLIDAEFAEHDGSKIDWCGAA
jgi:endonuclease YncB( thermonuclease family)